MIKTFVGGAAMAATSLSFLDAAFGQANSGEMALAGGGSLLVERRDGRWVGTVVDPDGGRISRPNGWVVLEGGRLIGLADGLVVDGTVVAADWAEHTDVIVFVQDGSAEQKASWPLWARGPVLPSQAQLLEQAFGGQTPTGMPQLQPPMPTVPTTTPTPMPTPTPTPQPDVRPPTPDVPRTVR